MTIACRQRMNFRLQIVHRFNFGVFITKQTCSSDSSHIENFIFILKRKIQVLRLVIPNIFPKRPLPPFSFSPYLLCTLSNPSPKLLSSLCGSGASAGPVLAGKTQPLQVVTLSSTVFSLYIVLQNFSPFCY